MTVVVGSLTAWIGVVTINWPAQAKIFIFKRCTRKQNFVTLQETGNLTLCLGNYFLCLLLICTDLTFNLAVFAIVSISLPLIPLHLQPTPAKLAEDWITVYILSANCTRKLAFFSNLSNNKKSYVQFSSSHFALPQNVTRFSKTPLFF